MPVNYEKLMPLSLKKLGKDERWLQDIIASDPAILGLGGVVRLRARERRQPTGGRLDLLLEDRAQLRRWEVEIQLGATDESHIIRTIEYWDSESRRFPEYEHSAVIVAEEITNRFFRVIDLFNRHIPITAIKLTAVEQPGGKVGVLFTTVLDEQSRGGESPVDSAFDGRAHWVERAGEAWVVMVEKIYECLASRFRGCLLRYNRWTIAMKQQGNLRNLVICRERDGLVEIRFRTARYLESLESRFRALSWDWERASEHDNEGDDYFVDFPVRDFSEEEFTLLCDIFRVAIGEEIESESASPTEAENPNA